MNFAALYPSATSLIISAQSGAFDASAAIFFLFALAVTHCHLSLPSVALLYLPVPLALLLIALLCFPDR